MEERLGWVGFYRILRYFLLSLERAEGFPDDYLCGLYLREEKCKMKALVFVLLAI
jgi:hypothetical protein